MKSNRHTKIVELINRFPITTQEELLDYLRKDGFDVTQSTVSRDIKQLRLSKSLDSNGRYRYTAPVASQKNARNTFLGLVDSSVVSVEYAMNIVVIKTYAGMAGAVCAAFDSMNYPSIIGTIAGDDTIFIVCKNEDSAKNYTHEFLRYVH